jgi:hypothetical protein
MVVMRINALRAVCDMVLYFNEIDFMKANLAVIDLA